MTENERTSDTDQQVPFRIVGIGASAGGLQALECLFDNLGHETGMAFVVIQHLSPDFDSIMDQLLGRHSKMPIMMMEDAVEVRPNHVYLLPPGKEAICSNGQLYVTERTDGRSLSYPIDEFLRSLAQDIGSRSVGIILSGTGTDGSRGICDISLAGGTVIAQSTDSAPFDGMARSALATGVVDFSIAPDEIARALTRIAAGELPSPPVEKSEGMKPLDHMDPLVRQIFNHLHSQFGLDFSQYKSAMIARRVERRVKLAGADDLTSYLELLRHTSEEVDRLYSDMLIGVTEFFRDKNVFNRLQLDVIPELVERLDEHDEFRCWVAGTATGQEAYSLAILLFEEFEKRDLEMKIRIFASDVHPTSLGIAGRGVYSSNDLANLSQERRDRFFTERNNGFHVIPELRKRWSLRPTT